MSFLLLEHIRLLSVKGENNRCRFPRRTYYDQTPS